MSSFVSQIEPEHPELFALEFVMSSFVSQIEPEHPELFALEFGKIAEYDFVYTLSSTNINQSAPNLVKL